MCFSSMPAMPAMPEIPKVVDQSQARQNASSSGSTSKTRQDQMTAQGTMLTAGGVDPMALELGKKTLLGG